jgi:hypothetical protein
MRGISEQPDASVEAVYDARRTGPATIRRSCAQAERLITVRAGTQIEPVPLHATENAIIRALLRREPVGGMTDAIWRFVQSAAADGCSTLAREPATGSIFPDAFHVAKVVGIELAPQMAAYLNEVCRRSGLDNPCTRRVRGSLRLADERFDIVSAIGVMFHIVDDDAGAEPWAIQARSSRAAS